MAVETVPEKLTEYIEGQSFAMINFNILPTTELPGVKIPIDWFDYEQQDEVLQSLEIESRSTFVNCFSFLV